MKKLICLSLISLVCGFLSVHASIQADDTKPFVAVTVLTMCLKEAMGLPIVL